MNSQDSIYHYTKLQTAMEKILFGNQLRFSTLSETNDPYEFKKIFFSYSEYIGPGGDANSDFANSKKINSELNTIIKEKTKVLCFCKNGRSTYAYQKSRMWSQYAENHRGVCLQLSRKGIYDWLKINTQTKAYLQKIDYKRIKASELEYRFINERIKNRYLDHIEAHRNSIYFTKNVDYRDESEVRLVIIDLENELKYLPLTNILMGVVIGDNCPKVYWKSIMDRCNELQIKTYRNHYENGQSIIRSVQDSDFAL
jgi:hypothetical protein